MSLRIDFNGLSQTHIGAAGISEADLTALKPATEAALASLLKAHTDGALGFMALPDDAAAAGAAQRLADSLKAQFDDLVVLGIGGSSLGGKALMAGLCHPFHNLLPKQKRGGLRLFFPDNADPSTFACLLEVIELKRTAFAAITKSGGTAETWAQLLLVNQRIGAAAAKQQIVAVTDPKKGALRAVAEAEGWQNLPVPPVIGGRFSAFTAVGLLPAAAAGIDITQLLAGARDMAARCRNTDVLKNPGALVASLLFHFDTQKKRPMHVLMPYADALRETGDWFVQLWAESLGKKKNGGHVGPMPIRAVGATDQHSILQMLMEGPQDKVTMFVAVESPRVDLTIPSGFEGQPDVKYLGGHTFHGLLSAEQRATSAALAANGRPSFTIQLPALNAYSMGELMMLLEVATGIAGGLYGVDPYDQPGVEAGKRYCCGLMGRPGYEASKAELDARPKANPDWVR